MAICALNPEASARVAPIDYVLRRLAAAAFDGVVRQALTRRRLKQRIA